jgi:predicted small secreted protein
MKPMNESNLTQQSQPKMIPFLKRIVFLLFVTALLAIVGPGCNTAHGFGKDVEKTGEKIQNGTK